MGEVSSEALNFGLGLALSAVVATAAYETGVECRQPLRRWWFWPSAVLTVLAMALLGHSVLDDAHPWNTGPPVFTLGLPVAGASWIVQFSMPAFVSLLTVPPLLVCVCRNDLARFDLATWWMEIAWFFTERVGEAVFWLRAFCDAVSEESEAIADARRQQMSPSFYDLLSVRECADDMELAAALRLKRIQLHPDRHVGNEEWATKEFQRIEQAYNCLSDPASRARYDAALGGADFG